MKSWLYTFTLLSFWSVTVAQQTLSVNWGDDFVFDRNTEYNEVIGIEHGKIYVLSSSALKAENSINVSLTIYNSKSLKLIEEMPLVQNKSNHNFEKLIITPNKILVFTSYYDRQLGLKILLLQEYDENNKSLINNVRIDEVSSRGKDNSKIFKISASPDGKSILIYHDNPTSTGYKVFNLKVINSEFTSIWEKELTLNYKSKMVNFSEILIDNGSNAYLLSTINPFGLRKSSGLGSLVNVKSTLFTYRPFEDKLKEYEFALSRNWISEVKISFDPEQNILATAFFTYPNDYKIRGFILFELNSENGDVTAKKIATLDKNQFKKIDQSIGRLKEYSKMLVGSTGIYPGLSSHMNSTSTEFMTKSVFVQRDKIVLAIEAFRRDERCTESFNDQQMIVDCQKNFLYGDIVLFYLNRDCEIQKITKVKKMQHSVNKLSPYYSFSLIGNEQGIYIFYNDDYRNMHAEHGEDKFPLTNLNKATMNIVAFDNRGNELDLSFTINRDGRIPFFPRGNISMTSSEFLLYSQREKNYKFGKLSIH